ncbi:MAG: hypothetical protein ACK5P7_04245 [Bdellovibrio sp.]|jgi:hypothetical protein
MTKVILTFLFLFSGAAFADIEPIKPESACERFLDSHGQEQCFTATREVGDSYVVALCNDQFSNDEFMRCLENSKLYSFDPKKLGACKNDEFSDLERVSCMNTVGVQRPVAADQMRLPASTKKAKKDKAKKTVQKKLQK